MKRSWLALTLLLFTTQACAVFSWVDVFVPPGGVLYQDKFSDPTSGWGSLTTNTGQANYDDGTYHIQVSAPNVNLWSHPGLDFTNVRVEADVYSPSGPLQNRMGVVCRLMDDQNFYFFVIGTDGYYAIGKVRNGNLSLLSAAQMQQSAAIHTGAEPNHVRGDCVANLLILYVNGQLVASAVDSDLPHGDVGLLAGTFAQPGANVYFDNFFVYKP